ncbi:MAG: DUF6311 domain-containing protein [Lachnospiraceae bacterium]|nr:DUF6311 domain-containing protein [Lachnospiraceae bacterium]
MNYNIKNNNKSILSKISPTCLHFLLGCILGGFIFVLIYGVSVLDVTNIDWLTHSKDNEGLLDLTQHYLGWVFYRNSDWHFPLGLADGLYSSPVSIVYTDSIPLFAFIFKTLSPILPETFQYFGIFGFITYCLTGGFGALIIAKFTKNPIFTGLTAIILAISPVLTKRMFYHTALSAHFLILIAITLWIYRDSSFLSIDSKGKLRLKKSYIVFWSLLTVSSALINAYYTPMIVGILLLSCLQDLISRGKNNTPIISHVSTVFASILTTAIAAFSFGYFYGDVAPSTGGLTNLSFNLNQLINPDNYLCQIENYNYNFTPQSYSKILPGLKVISGWQEEGFSYLGLGIIVALVLLIIVLIIKSLSRNNTFSTKDLFKKYKSWIITLTLGLIIFVLLAMSPIGTIGSKTIYDIPYPEIVMKTLSIFRSCGRFIWPVYYGMILLIITGISKLYEHFSKNNKFISRSIVAIFIAVFVLQIYDISPSLAYKNDVYSKKFSTYDSPLKDPAWDELGENASEIMFYTPSLYGIECNPELSCIFEHYALEYNLSLNVTYMSRDMSSFADKKTLSHFKEREKGKSYPDIIYVFYDISEIPPAEESHLNYYKLDGYIVGTERQLNGLISYYPPYPAKSDEVESETPNQYQP